MTLSARTALGIAALSLACVSALGQAAPSAATSVQNAVAPDVLSYSLSASDSLVTGGYNGGNGASNSFGINGTATALSSSVRYPRSFVYSGGYLIGGYGQPSTSYHNLGISQGLNTRKLSLTISDLVNFLPNAPLFGLAGVPGIGDIGTSPISVGSAPIESVLTNYGQRVVNTVSGSATYGLTGKISVGGSGAYSIQRFISNTGGIDSNQIEAGAQVSDRITGKTSAGAGYTFLQSSYPGQSFSFTSNGVVGFVTHTFNPRLSLSGNVGPQWTSGSNSLLIPSRVSLEAGASVFYQLERTSLTASYSRGTNAGSGVLFGTISDTLLVAARHNFNPNWSGGLNATFSHSSSLSKLPGFAATATAFTAGVQANRRISESFFAYGSYTVQVQSVSNLLATANAYDGTTHVVTVGLTYSPQPIHFRRK